MGLVTRFSPSHIAQFWRDWTATLGYRSADQNGGSARVQQDTTHLGIGMVTGARAA